MRPTTYGGAGWETAHLSGGSTVANAQLFRLSQTVSHDYAATTVHLRPCTYGPAPTTGPLAHRRVCGGVSADPGRIGQDRCASLIPPPGQGGGCDSLGHKLRV